MGIKWNPDFNKKEHKKEALEGAQEILQKAGAKTWVAPVKRRVTKYTSGKSFWEIKREKTQVTREFVYPGALVKVVGDSRKYLSSAYCTVVACSYESNETATYGKWWDCILPDGRTTSVNSRDMRPLDVQNGNLPSMEDEEEEA